MNSQKWRRVHPQSLIKDHVKVLHLVGGFVHGLVLNRQYEGIIRILFGKVHCTKEKLLKDNADTRVRRKLWSRTFQLIDIP